MKKKNHILSAVILTCFLFNTILSGTGFASHNSATYRSNRENLSPPMLCDDLGKEKTQKNIGNIKFLLEGKLRIIAGDQSDLPADIDQFNKQRFGIARMGPRAHGRWVKRTKDDDASSDAWERSQQSVHVHFFFSRMNQLREKLEAAGLTVPSGYHFVQCRVKDDNAKGKTTEEYYAVFGTTKDDDGGFPIRIYTEDEFKKFFINSEYNEFITQGILPQRKPEDTEAIDSYVEHEKKVDKFFADKMKDPKARFACGSAHKTGLLSALDLVGLLRKLGLENAQSIIKGINDRRLIFVRANKEELPVIHMKNAFGESCEIRVAVHTSNDAVWITLNDKEWEEFQGALPALLQLGYIKSGEGAKTRDTTHIESDIRDKGGSHFMPKFQKSLLHEIGVMCGLNATPVATGENDSHRRPIFEARNDLDRLIDMKAVDERTSIDQLLVDPDASKPEGMGELQERLAPIKPVNLDNLRGLSALNVKDESEERYSRDYAASPDEKEPNFDRLHSSQALFDKLRGIQHKDIARIEMRLGAMDSIAGIGIEVPAEDSVFSKGTIKFVLSNPVSLGSKYISIECQIKDSPHMEARIYHVVIKRDGNMPIEIFANNEHLRLLKRLSASGGQIEQIPYRKGPDRIAINRYKEHERSTDSSKIAVDRWIEQKMREGHYAVAEQFHHSLAYHDIYGNADFTFAHGEQVSLLEEFLGPLDKPTQSLLVKLGCSRDAVLRLREILANKPLVIIRKDKDEELPIVTMSRKDDQMPDEVHVYSHSSDSAIYIVLEDDLFETMGKMGIFHELDIGIGSVFHLYNGNGGENYQKAIQVIRERFFYEIGVQLGLLSNVADGGWLTNPLIEAKRAYNGGQAQHKPRPELAALMPVKLSETLKTRDYAAGEYRETDTWAVETIRAHRPELDYGLPHKLNELLEEQSLPVGLRIAARVLLLKYNYLAEEQVGGLESLASTAHGVDLFAETVAVASVIWYGDLRRDAKKWHWRRLREISTGKVNNRAIALARKTMEFNLEDTDEAPTAAVRGEAELGDLAPHPLVNALIGMAIEAAPKEGFSFVTVEETPNARIFWFGYSEENGKTFLDSFNYLVMLKKADLRLETFSLSSQRLTERAELEVAKKLVKIASLEGEVKANREFVEDLKRRLHLQMEHFAVRTKEDGKISIYAMAAYKPHDVTIVRHVLTERAMHDEAIDHLFDGNFEGYQKWRRGDSSAIQNGVSYVSQFSRSNGIFLRVEGRTRYNDFAQKAHEIAESLFPLANLSERSDLDVEVDSDLYPEGLDVPVAARRSSGANARQNAIQKIAQTIPAHDLQLLINVTKKPKLWSKRVQRDRDFGLIVQAFHALLDESGVKHNLQKRPQNTGEIGDLATLQEALELQRSPTKIHAAGPVEEDMVTLIVMSVRARLEPERRDARKRLSDAYGQMALDVAEAVHMAINNRNDVGEIRKILEEQYSESDAKPVVLAAFDAVMKNFRKVMPGSHEDGRLTQTADQIRHALVRRGKTQPGRSPKAALEAIARSSLIQRQLRKNGFFTFDDYRAGYMNVRSDKRAAWKALPPEKANDSQSKKDLRDLASQGYLVINEVKGSNEYELKDKGHAAVCAIRLKYGEIPNTLETGSFLGIIRTFVALFRVGSTPRDNEAQRVSTYIEHFEDSPEAAIPKIEALLQTDISPEAEAMARVTLLLYRHKPEIQIMVLERILSLPVEHDDYTAFALARVGLLLYGYKEEAQLAELNDALRGVKHHISHDEAIALAGLAIYGYEAALQHEGLQAMYDALPRFPRKPEMKEFFELVQAQLAQFEHFKAIRDGSSTRQEISSMQDLAEDAARDIPVFDDERYTLLVPFTLYAEGKLEEHKQKYEDAFDLEGVSGRGHDQFLRNVLANARGKENRTIVLVPRDLPTSYLNILKNAGIRFIREGLEGQSIWKKAAKKSEDRERFLVNTYTIMLLARRVDERSISEDSPTYKLLAFYLKSHFHLSEVAIEDYIKAILNGHVPTLIKGYLSYRPAIPGNLRQEYDRVSEVFLSA